MIIRPATVADYPALADLWFESWQSIGISNETDLSREEVAERFLSETLRWSLFAGEMKGEVAGMLALLPGEQRLDQIFVAPRAKGTGLGLALLNHAKSLMPDQIILTTHETNFRARAFYEREGFLLVGRADDLEHRRVRLTYEWLGQDSR